MLQASREGRLATLKSEEATLLLKRKPFEDRIAAIRREIDAIKKGKRKRKRKRGATASGGESSTREGLLFLTTTYKRRRRRIQRCSPRCEMYTNDCSIYRGP